MATGKPRIAKYAGGSVERRGCALCLQSAVLQQSHLLPKALYRMVRGDGKNPHPLNITANGWFQSSFQEKAHLLCAECEQRFHQGGENWVLKHLLRKDGSFLLWDKVVKHSQNLSDERCTVYKVAADAGIDFNALAYFAASIIWKAAAHPWRGGGEEITLGERYQEQFRLYLLHEQEFPEDAALIVDITRPENRLKPIIGDPATARWPTHFQHSFFTPGVVFEIAAGKLIPEAVRRLCSLRNRFIVSSNHEEKYRSAYRSMSLR